MNLIDQVTNWYNQIFYCTKKMHLMLILNNGLNVILSLIIVIFCEKQRSWYRFIFRRLRLIYYYLIQNRLKIIINEYLLHVVVNVIVIKNRDIVSCYIVVNILLILLNIGFFYLTHLRAIFLMIALIIRL